MQRILLLAAIAVVSVPVFLILAKGDEGDGRPRTARSTFEGTAPTESSASPASIAGRGVDGVSSRDLVMSGSGVGEAGVGSDVKPHRASQDDLLPRIAIQNVRPEGFLVSRDELPEMVRRLAKVDGSALLKQKFGVGGFRDKIGQLPLGSRQAAEDLIQQGEVQIESLSAEAEVLLSDAQDDWFLEGRFQVHLRHEGPPPVRPSEGSHLATNAVFGIGPFIVDVGFRSADYPGLEYILNILHAERERLRTELNGILGSNGLPLIYVH